MNCRSLALSLVLANAAFSKGYNGLAGRFAAAAYLWRVL
jgi:hypothetical protein